MKIKIKEFQGRHAVNGFYPKPSVRIRPGEVFEFEEGEEDQFEACLATGAVEEVREPRVPRRRGRPSKAEAVDSEEDQSGA